MLCALVFSMTSRLVAAKCASPVSRHASRMASGSSVPSARGARVRTEAPTTTAWPPPRPVAWCDPRLGDDLAAARDVGHALTRLPIVPLATNRAASLPELRRAVLERVDGRVVPKTSSPTSASAIARRIAGLGWVTVSDRRSMSRRASRHSTLPGEGSADPAVERRRRFPPTCYHPRSPHGPVV